MKARSVLWSVALGLLVAAPAARADYSFNFNPFTVTAPDSRNFGNSTNPLSNPVGTLAAGASPPNFLDYWNFELTNTADIGSFVGSINFTDGVGGPVTQGINNLELRLVGPSGTVFGSGTVFNIPLVPQQQVFSVVAQNGSFDPGLYRLEVRGELVGSTSSYGGKLNAIPAAVPLPAALPLLLAGLGLMGFVGRRRGMRPGSADRSAA
jgi:hypothetical protein